MTVDGAVLTRAASGTFVLGRLLNRFPQTTVLPPWHVSSFVLSVLKGMGDVSPS